jgi:hypothetical protein
MRYLMNEIRVTLSLENFLGAFLITFTDPIPDPMFRFPRFYLFNFIYVFTPNDTINISYYKASKFKIINK